MSFHLLSHYPALPFPPHSRPLNSRRNTCSAKEAPRAELGLAGKAEPWVTRNSFLLPRSLCLCGHSFCV
jgi:hypothetical protein